MRPATPEKTCPNCSFLHTRWGETCRERLRSEVTRLRADLENLQAATRSLLERVSEVPGLSSAGAIGLVDAARRVERLLSDVVPKPLPAPSVPREVEEALRQFREIEREAALGGADGVSCESPGGEGDGGSSVGPTSDGDAPRQAASTPPTSTPGAPTAGGPSAPSEKEGM